MVTTGEALEVISGGHAIYTPEFAQRVCDALGVEWDAELVQVYETDILPLGVRMKHGPADGVWSLELARYIAEQLGVQDKTRRFLGRGSQAREYARVVAEALGVKASGDRCLIAGPEAARQVQKEDTMDDRGRFLQLAEERLSEADTLYKHAMTCLDSPAQEPDDHVTSLLDRARAVALIGAGYATLALAIAPEERR